MKKGFTLIELLVVIAIIAVLVSLGVASFLDARQRATDNKKKSEMVQMKSALRLYYNDYGKYPTSSFTSPNVQGCGTTGTTLCPGTCTSYEFAAGGDGCSTANVYMKRLPRLGSNGTYGWNYYVASSTDDFCLNVKLDNLSDAEIANSQTRCAAACGANCNTSGRYCQCAD